MIVTIIAILVLYDHYHPRKRLHDFLDLNIPYYHDYILKHSKDQPFYITEIYNKDYLADKIISVSIYGNHSKYFEGLEQLIKNTKIYFPDWKLRVYAHDKIPLKYKNMLISNYDIETYFVHDNEVVPGNAAGMFWRFLPLLEPITVIFSDVDLLNEKDNELAEGITSQKVNNWLKSDKGLFRASSFLMRTKTWILGGAWGKKSYIQLDKDIITNYPFRKRYGVDELFLQKNIYNLVKKYGIMTFINRRKFSSPLYFKISPTNSQLAKYNSNDDEIIIDNIYDT